MSNLQEASIEMMDVVYLKGREADKGLNVVFSYEPHLNNQKSVQEGRPIYDDREYVTIKVPGDKDSIVVRPVTDMDRRRFAPLYKAFKDGRTKGVSGTPLQAVSWLSAGRIKELEFFNIHTLEQLASLSDAHAQQFVGIHTLRQHARDHIEAAQEAAPLVRMRVELEAKENEIATLRNSISEQGSILVQMQRQLQMLAANQTQPTVQTTPAVQTQSVDPPIVSPRPVSAQVPGGKRADNK